MTLDPKTEKRVSKFISMLLRHKPEALGLEMDTAGWVSVDALLTGLRTQYDVTLADIEAIVAADEKGRYTLQGGRIRANQGHSVNVDLGLQAIAPPATLYHGTVTKFLDAILTEGLRPQGRQHVHLSPDLATARQVGGRRGKPVILLVDCAALSFAGHLFYLSDNGVWLTDHVPPSALSLCEETRP